MTDNINTFRYGLEIIEGLMGAGKSYYSVRRVCQVIEETRRPVYTNLPLKWPVMRAFLRKRGGEELANLIRPLTKEHWFNFLRRQLMHAQFREGVLRTPPDELTPDQLDELSRATGKPIEKIKQQSKLHDAQLWAWFHYTYGPDTLEGPDADAIPPGAVIVIDEVQHWHPMDTQRDHKERRLQLQAYLTMCRHHLHWIWVITQDRSRIDILLRNLASSVWRVWDRGEDRLAWGIRFKHLGMRGMGYQRYTRDQLEHRDPENVKPSESFTILPQMPWNKVYFRLYSSFTNIGSKRQIMKVIQRARVTAGLDASGITEIEKQQREADQMKQYQKPPFFRRWIKRAAILALITGASTIAYAIGQQTAPTQLVENTNAADKPAPHNWPKFNGITASAPIFDSRPAKVGSKVGDRGELRFYDADTRSCVVVADDAYWLFRFGRDLPNLVGPVDAVQAAFERMEQAANDSARIDDAASAGR